MPFVAQNWLLDSLPDGVIVIGADWRIAFVNRAAEALLRLRREAVVGEIPSQALLQSPAEWVEAYREVLESREPRRLPEIHLGDGAEEQVFSGEVLPSPTGGVGVVFRDVSERRRDEAALRLRDRAVASTLNGIVLTDATLPDNPIIYVNPAFTEMTGYAAEEALGRNCRFLQRDDREQPGLDELRRAVGEGRSCTVTLRNYRKDGTPFWNELGIAPVCDEAGRLTHFVGIQQDVTGRKRAQDELVQRNAELKQARDELALRNGELAEATQAKDRFMATMSHEMRTPLNAILGYVELLGLGVAGEVAEAQRRYLGRIGTSGRALLELINDVLDFTRAEVGRLPLELRPLHLQAVVEEAAELVELHAREKRIPVSTPAPAGPLPPVLGDFRRLRQVLTNLLSNAVKFTHEGAVSVSYAQPDADHLSVTVSDTGIGIPADKLTRVFSEFYQADSDLTREYGGTGLGLAISQRLARLMDGAITVESEPGRGSRFTLTLPVATPAVLERHAAEQGLARWDDMGVGEPPEEARDDPGATGETAPAVVVFGEHEEALASLRRRLEPGVRVVGTTVPQSVAELARRERPVLVVVDVACNGGIGWQAAHEVREDDLLDDVAVLLLPCFPRAGEGDGPSGALDLGWVAVVPKPYSSTQLTRMVERAARRGAGPDEAAPARRDVLVVDDDPDARDIAAHILSSAGAVVREAHDGEAGLAEMRRRAPDVAVIDLMLPVLDGFGVVAAMRADPALRDIPVVVLTAKDLSEAERRFLSRTAEAVMQKGVHSLSDVATLIVQAAGTGNRG